MYLFKLSAQILGITADKVSNNDKMIEHLATLVKTSAHLVKFSTNWSKTALPYSTKSDKTDAGRSKQNKH